MDANPTDATVNFTLNGAANTQGDILADFSLRGPDPAPYQDITKPDITGPGVPVYAAFPINLGAYGTISGISIVRWSSGKICLANHYNSVIIAASKEAETAVVPRLLKWIGRSPVERAAAASFPACSGLISCRQLSQKFIKFCLVKHDTPVMIDSDI